MWYNVDYNEEDDGNKTSSSNIDDKSLQLITTFEGKYETYVPTHTPCLSKDFGMLPIKIKIYKHLHVICSQKWTHKFLEDAWLIRGHSNPNT